MTSKPRIELLYVPGCPLRDRVRAAVEECLADMGVRSVIEEREGAYPSPTLLIDGLDVITAGSPDGPPRCRVDLPTREQIQAALTGTRS
jgi:hypothetical protein